MRLLTVLMSLPSFSMTAASGGAEASRMFSVVARLLLRLTRLRCGFCQTNLEVRYELIPSIPSMLIVVKVQSLQLLQCSCWLIMLPLP